jgi:hypothetical protein
MPTKEAVLDWRGQTMTTTDGEKIGKIGEIYLDRDTDQPEWALVNTGNVRLEILVRADRRRAG